MLADARQFGAHDARGRALDAFDAKGSRRFTGNWVRGP